MAETLEQVKRRFGPDAVFDVRAWFYIPSGQDSLPLNWIGSIKMDLLYFSDARCQNVYGPSPPLSAYALDQWHESTRLDQPIPGGAQSFRAELRVNKEGAGGSVEVFFDEVVVIPEPEASYQTLTAILVLLALRRAGRPGSDNLPVIPS